MPTISLDKISVKTHLTEAEAEVYSGFERSKLFQFRTKGSSKGIRLPYCKVGKILYRKTDIDKFIDQHKVNTQVL